MLVRVRNGLNNGKCNALPFLPHLCFETDLQEASCHMYTTISCLDISIREAMGVLDGWWYMRPVTVGWYAAVA